MELLIDTNDTANYFLSYHLVKVCEICVEEVVSGLFKLFLARDRDQ